MPKNDRYIISPDKSGWLKVKFGGQEVSLPHYLKVHLLRTEGGREYFKVMEGGHRSREASVKLKADGSSYLGGAELRHLPAARLKFNRRMARLWYGAHGPVPVKLYEDNPVPLGQHPLEIPDHPHPGGLLYTDASDYTTVWFHINTPQPADSLGQHRYLHAGSVSAGCVTIIVREALGSWTDIFNYAIRRREGDGKNVGTIEVVE